MSETTVSERARSIFGLCLAAFAAAACAALCASGALSRSVPQGPGNQPDELHQLWTATIDPMLQGTIQSSEQAYNYGHYLMVPLHAAFQRHDAAWERACADHFQRLMENPSVLPSVPLSRLQYLYLASRFVVLAKQNGAAQLIPAGLPDLLFAEILSHWQNKPAIQWDHADFQGGMRERLLWKLNTRRVAKSYYRGILDDDFFLFAIAADLRTYGGTVAQQQEWNPALNDVLTLAHRVLSQEVVPQPGGGWLLQPGAWTDHPEFQYAGNAEARPGIQPVPVPNIPWDSSHSHRFPLWLTSYMQAYAVNSDWYRFYAGLRDGLEKQFFNRVAVTPTSNNPCYLTENYMDGSNGVYRWNHASLGSGKGYGPYGVSPALMLGWWSFLDTDRTRQLYRDLANRFPWPRQCLEIYIGQNPDGTYPESEMSSQSRTMRRWHLIALLASEM
jgi:hypothetical protein